MSDHILMGASFPGVRRKERREEETEENVVMAQILILMATEGKFED